MFIMFCLAKIRNLLVWMVFSLDSVADGIDGWSESSAADCADVPTDLLADGSPSTHLH